MTELTEEQKQQAQKIFNELMDYMWAKVKARMLITGEPLEVAVSEVIRQAIEEGKHND